MGNHANSDRPGLKPKTFLLWGKSAIHQSTVATMMLSHWKKITILDPAGGELLFKCLILGVITNLSALDIYLIKSLWRSLLLSVAPIYILHDHQLNIVFYRWAIIARLQDQWNTSAGLTAALMGLGFIWKSHILLVFPKQLLQALKCLGVYCEVCSRLNVSRRISQLWPLLLFPNIKCQTLCDRELLGRKLLPSSNFQHFSLVTVFISAVLLQ